MYAENDTVSLFFFSFVCLSLLLLFVCVGVFFGFFVGFFCCFVVVVVFVVVVRVGWGDGGGGGGKGDTRGKVPREQPQLHAGMIQMRDTTAFIARAFGCSRVAVTNELQRYRQSVQTSYKPVTCRSRLTTLYDSDIMICFRSYS